MATVQLTTIAEAIADIDLSGQGIRSFGIDAIPENAGMVVPCFVPNPDNYITDLLFSEVTFGATGAKMDLEYTLNYSLLFAPVGAGLGLFSVYGKMIEAAAFIMETIFESSTPSGAVTFQLQNIPTVAVLKDAAGNDYHGLQMSFRVKEFVA